MGRLPVVTQAMFAMQKDAKMADIAQLADKINESIGQALASNWVSVIGSLTNRDPEREPQGGNMTGNRAHRPGGGHIRDIDHTREKEATVSLSRNLLEKS